jgi:hypothetical protein
VSALSDDLIDLVCTMKAVRLEHGQIDLSNSRAEMGDSVLVESNGVEMLMSSPDQRRVGSLPLRMNRPPFSFSGFSVMEK